MNVIERDFDRLTEGLGTKSAKIRALGREGVGPSPIASYLGISYQFAYNVLNEAKLLPRQRSAESSNRSAPPSIVGVGRGDRKQRGHSESAWTAVGPDGRIELPAGLLEAVGIDPGERVHLRATDDGIEVLSRRAALKRAQAIARQFVPEGVSLVDELIAERRLEAAMENE